MATCHAVNRPCLALVGALFRQFTDPKGDIVVKRSLTALAGAFLLLGSLAGTAAATSPVPANKNSSASASSYLSAAVVKPAAVPSGCSATYFCFWNGTGYSDGPGKLSGTNSNWTAFSHSSCPSGTWNDCASSDYNDGVNDNALLWTAAGYSGSVGIVYRGTGGDFNSTFNNLVSSNSWQAP
jgi:hypothetical protein